MDKSLSMDTYTHILMNIHGNYLCTYLLWIDLEPVRFPETEQVSTSTSQIHSSNNASGKQLIRKQ